MGGVAEQPDPSAARSGVRMIASASPRLAGDGRDVEAVGGNDGAPGDEPGASRGGGANERLAQPGADAVRGDDDVGFELAAVGQHSGRCEAVLGHAGAGAAEPQCVLAHRCAMYVEQVMPVHDAKRRAEAFRDD